MYTGRTDSTRTTSRRPMSTRMSSDGLLRQSNGGVRLSRAEWWILSFVDDAREPLWLLAAEPGVPCGNRPHLGLGSSAASQVVLRMVRKGWIDVSIDNRIITKSSITASNVKRMVLQVRRDDEGEESWRSRLAYYGLTAKGGEIWEAFCMARWDRRVLAYTELDRNGVRLECVDKRWLKRTIPIIASVRGIPESACVWSVAMPWRVAYWKTLPKAFAVFIPGVSSLVEWVAIPWHWPKCL